MAPPKQKHVIEARVLREISSDLRRQLAREQRVIGGTSYIPLGGLITRLNVYEVRADHLMEGDQR